MKLRDLVQELVDRHGSQLAASQSSGIDRTRLRAVLQDETGSEGLELLNCLKLARALQRSPSEVLTAAGKRKDHELIEALYGTEHDLALSREERQLIEAARSTPDYPEKGRRLRAIVNGIVRWLDPDCLEFDVQWYPDGYGGSARMRPPQRLQLDEVVLERLDTPPWPLTPVPLVAGRLVLAGGDSHEYVVDRRDDHRPEWALATLHQNSEGTRFLFVHELTSLRHGHEPPVRLWPGAYRLTTVDARTAETSTSPAEEVRAQVREDLTRELQKPRDRVEGIVTIQGAVPPRRNKDQPKLERKWRWTSEGKLLDTDDGSVAGASKGSRPGQSATKPPAKSRSR